MTTGRWPRFVVAVALVAGGGPIADGVAGAQTVYGSSCSALPDMTANGRYVVYDTDFPHVPSDVNGVCDVYLWNVQAGTYQLISAAHSGGGAGNRLSIKPTISNDGRYVAFESAATNLVAGDTNGFRDVFVRDRQAGRTVRASVTPSGTQGDGGSFAPDVAGNGGVVAFETDAANLVGGDSNGVRDILTWKRASGTLARASVTSSGAQADGPSVSASANDAGTVIGFETVAGNLSAEGGRTAAVVRNATTGRTTSINPPCQGVVGCLTSVIGGPKISGDGKRAVVSHQQVDPETGQQLGFAGLYTVPAGKALMVNPDSYGSNLYVVAISRDGQQIAYTFGSGDLIELDGGRGYECVDDPDNEGGIAISGNGGLVVWVEYRSYLTVQQLDYTDPDCIFL